MASILSSHSESVAFIPSASQWVFRNIFITGYRIRYAKHYLFVEIDTDEGITGLGEAGNWTFLKPTAEAIREMCDFMIGKAPSRIEDWNQNFYRAQYFRGSVVMSAISAIDIALWDIKG